MMDIWVKRKAMEVLASMTTAITAWRLYPANNSMVVNAIESLYKSLEELFQKEKSFILSETEKTLLIYNEQISQIELKQPKIAALFEILLNFEIKSITINPGATIQDLKGFVDIFTQNPEAIKLSGGIKKVLAERKIAHIILAQKVYTSYTSKNNLLASIDIRDDEIIDYIMGANPELDLDSDQVREMAQSSEWVEQIFRNGMNQIRSKRYIPNTQFSENMVRMMTMLDRIVDKRDQEKFSQMMAKAIADLEDEKIASIISQDVDGFLDGKILRDVLDQLDEGKIDRVMDIIQNKQSHAKPLPGRDDAIIISPQDEEDYQSLVGSDKKRKLQELKEVEKSRKEQKINDLKQEIAPLLAGEEETLLNPELMDSLPGIVNDLVTHEQHETVEAMIGRLGEALLSERQDIRDSASAGLVKVIEALPEKKQQAVAEQLSMTLMRWIQLETSATEAHKKLSSRLKDHMINLIQDKRYAECLPLLNAFHLIDYGFLEKNEAIKKTAAEIINALASSYRLDLLFTAYRKSGDYEKMDIGRILSRLGSPALHRLMDMLRDQPDGDERVRILHLVKEIGTAAVPVIKERSLKDFPWYHHRNLAYLLRFIKHNAAVDVLHALLKHDHQKVREEALESLYIAGENERGPVLLSLLPTADDSFKISIIEHLGKIRYKEAAAVLIEMLKNRPLRANAARKDMEEVICIALGKIGTPEAVALLTQISKQKFYSIGSYPEKVRNAATRALMSLNS